VFALCKEGKEAGHSGGVGFGVGFGVGRGVGGGVGLGVGLGVGFGVGLGVRGPLHSFMQAVVFLYCPGVPSAHLKESGGLNSQLKVVGGGGAYALTCRDSRILSSRPVRSFAVA
jgi:hypothetical protein